MLSAPWPLEPRDPGPPDTAHLFAERTTRRRPDQVYYLYTPPREGRPGGPPRRLLVVIHGQSRGAVRYAQWFVPFADRHGYAILAPRFAPGLPFQELGLGGERVDLRLLELVDEVAAELDLDGRQFDLFGYSAGAQFAHRFLYVQPNRLRAVAIGAPGTVTLPTERERWPVGTGGLKRSAGVRIDLSAVKRTRVLLLVGTEDVTVEGLNQRPWAMRAGPTRLGRARGLHAAWLAAGIGHEYAEIPESGHGLDATIVDRVCAFLAPAPTLE